MSGDFRDWRPEPDDEIDCEPFLFAAVILTAVALLVALWVYLLLWH